MMLKQIGGPKKIIAKKIINTIAKVAPTKILINLKISISFIPPFGNDLRLSFPMFYPKCCANTYPFIIDKQTVVHASDQIVRSFCSCNEAALHPMCDRHAAVTVIAAPAKATIMEIKRIP